MESIKEADGKSAQRSEKVRLEADRGAEEASALQQFVYDRANPSPVMVALCIVLIICVAWWAHAVFLRPNASGQWVDEADRIWVLHHPIRGEAIALIDGKRSVRVTIRENLVRCGDRLGVWNYQNVIVWVGGGGLQRIRG